MRLVLQKVPIIFIATLTILAASLSAFSQSDLGNRNLTPTKAPTKSSTGIITRAKKRTQLPKNADHTEANSSATNSAATDSKPEVEPLYNPGLEDKQQGIDAFKKQQYDVAIQHLEVAAGIRKADPEVFYYLGDAYEEKDNYPKAIEAYEHARSFSPGDASAENLFRLGFSYEILPANTTSELTKNNTSALTAYREADQKRPNNVETLTHLGDVSSKLNQWLPAIAYYETAFKLDNSITDAELFLNWAIAYVNGSRDYEQALQRVKRAIELNLKPENVAEAYYYLGRSSKETNRIPEAIDAYLKQLEKKNDDLNAWDAYRSLSFIYAARGDWQGQADALKSAIKIKSDDDFLWNNLGIAEGNLSHTDAAVEAFRQAVSLVPSKTEYQLNLARTYSKLNRHSEVLDVLGKTVQIDPNLADAFFYRGASQQFLKQFDPAIASLSRAIELGLKKSLEGYARYYLVLSYGGVGNTSAARQQCDVLRGMGSDAPPASVGPCGNQ